jgi:hypothetical protein
MPLNYVETIPDFYRIQRGHEYGVVVRGESGALWRRPGFCGLWPPSVLVGNYFIVYCMTFLIFELTSTVTGIPEPEQSIDMASSRRSNEEVHHY